MKSTAQRLFFGIVLTSLSQALLAQNPLAIPPALTGPTFNLSLQSDSTQFLTGAKTETYGINQSYLAPTLIMQQGQFVTLNVTNDLHDTTTLHWHGMHVAAQDDGGPHTTIAPMSTWSPDFNVLDESATMWYHPHLHYHTAEQVYWGAAGMIIIRDPHEASLNLPRTYGVDDFPLVIQDKSFDSTTNQLIYEELSDTMMVNGTLNPYLEVPAQMVRLRLLNASNQRVYNLGFPQNVAWQIASDGGLLAQPLPITRMQIAPGERAEVVVNFGLTTAVLPLVANNSEMGTGISGGPGGPGGGPGNPLDGNNFPILQFRVVPQTPNPVTSLPNNLRTYDIPSLADVSVTRVKTFDTLTTSFPYLINSTLFDMDHINDTVMLGATEIWELRNHTNIAHPFHIHDVQFHVIEFNGQTPPAHLAGRKDVVLLQPLDTIRFITRFEDFADMHTPYMYHCHNLFHEDGGMMAQFVVMDTMQMAAPDPAQANAARVMAWPQPAGDGTLHLRDRDPQGPAIQAIRITDLQGRTLRTQPWPQGQAEWQLDIHDLAQGAYLLHIQSRGRQATMRILR